MSIVTINRKNIHSVIDIITNSSTEMYVIKNQTKEILRGMLSEAQGDSETFYINYLWEYDKEQIEDILEEIGYEKVLGKENFGVYYSTVLGTGRNFIIEANMDELILFLKKTHRDLYIENDVNTTHLTKEAFDLFSKLDSKYLGMV